MLRVYSCIVHEHDLRLIVLAGIICLLAALTSFSIFEQARATERRRGVWLALAAFVSGTGIWATHFVAMLAFQPHLPIGYDVPQTLLSIAAAITLCGAAWWTAMRPGSWWPAMAGLVAGTAIATMHHIGMAAMEIGGRIVWDETLLIASSLIGLILSAAAMMQQVHRPNLNPWRAALLFTLAICGLHFTAMAAAGIYPDPNIVVPTAAIGNDTLTVAVVAIAVLILAISFAMVVFDRRLTRNAEEEAQRIRLFADAALEGLLVLDGDRVVDANRSLLALGGYDRIADVPRDVTLLFPDLDLSTLPRGTDAATECAIARADGRLGEVEVLLRSFDWRGEERLVLAVRDVSERKEAAARIAHLAFHDALTGLPNRAVFTDSLSRDIEKAGATSETVSVLCIDLDGFKAVNDLHGHPAGDELLVAVAQRLRGVVGDGLVARLGGDEFAAIQQGGTQPADAGFLARRIVEALEQPFEINAGNVRIGASVGVAVFPADAATPAVLAKNADMALYRAKNEGRGLIRFYEATMDEALRERRQLEADLRLAIAGHQIKVHYQPLADLETGGVIGFEALARWEHPRLGAVSPETFVRLAEESGLIFELGEWVLRTACADAAKWNPPLKLSVNLSPLQFAHHDLVGVIERILGEAGLDPRRLDLEVTEGLLIQDAEAALHTLRRLKALGVQISMDDFGTGYSSLSYFRMFPFDRVKIDQSFVRDMIDNPQARAIVRSVIGLGRGLGMPVAAEGVETAEQLEALRAEGCDQVQGYLISRPNPIGFFEGVILGAGESTKDEGRKRA